MASDWSLTEQLDRWIFETYRTSRAGLADFRLVFAVGLALFFLPWPGEAVRIGQLPDALYDPPIGPLMLFGGFPPNGVMYGLQAVMWLAAVALVVGRRVRVASLALGGALVFYNGFLYSTGKIDHGLHLMVTLPLILAFSGWEGERTDASDSEVDPAWTLALLALVVGFSMLTAGLAKIGGGWFALEDQAVQNFLHTTIRRADTPGLLAGVAANLPGPVWEAADWSTVIFEVGFLPAIFSRRWFAAFCAVAVLFHTGVLLILSIAFTGQLLVYAAFLDWDRYGESGAWLRRCRRRLEAADESSWITLLIRAGAVAAALGASKYGLDLLLGSKLAGASLSTYLFFAVAVAVVGHASFQGLRTRLDAD